MSLPEGQGLMRALVTGAGRRLGREIALWLARRGYDVAVHYASSEEAAQDVVREIRALGRQAEALRADLLVEAETEALVPRAVEALGGPLDLLVNNASIFEHDTIAGATRESWDRHMGSNLRAPFVLIQRFAAQAPGPEVDERGEPRARALAVNIIDQRVLHPAPDFATYTLSKAGLWTLTRLAAQEYGPRLRVNGIGPGPTLQGAHQSVEDFAEERAGTVLGRGASPADITAALGFLLDAPAVTGQMICVDGGQHLGQPRTFSPGC
ncbi:SDR family oxidoreductase [Rhodobacter sp. NSM]|uniref:SDR family oxidoreductase n=1 Tax=Rhodobacter sp. NSM TaxID=3457501 RepID=UPI003FCFA425